MHDVLLFLVLDHFPFFCSVLFFNVTHSAIHRCTSSGSEAVPQNQQKISSQKVDGKQELPD
jgi:hypothetical protein